MLTLLTVAQPLAMELVEVVLVIPITTTQVVVVKQVLMLLLHGLLSVTQTT